MCAASFRWRARRARTSGDSQFFICFDDATFLDGKYSVWGKVTSGMENVDKIKRGEPVANPDKIVKARMAADPGLSGRSLSLPVFGEGRVGLFLRLAAPPALLRGRGPLPDPPPQAGEGTQGPAVGNRSMRSRLGRATALLPLPLAGEGGGEAARKGA